MTDNVRAELLELAKSVCHGHRGQVSEFIDALVDAGYRKDTSLLAERDALRKLLGEAIAFVEYSIARKGAQTDAEIAEELKNVKANVSRVGTGHWREEITFDLARARAALRQGQ